MCLKSLKQLSPPLFISVFEQHRSFAFCMLKVPPEKRFVCFGIPKFRCKTRDKFYFSTPDLIILVNGSTMIMPLVYEIFGTHVICVYSLFKLA